MQKNKCCICGGRIVAESFGLWGSIQYIRRDGTVGRELRRKIYPDSTGEWLYYCEACGQDYTKEFEPGWDK